MRRIPRLTEMVPRGQLAGICGEAAVQIGAHIARRTRKGRCHIGVTGGGHGRITRVRGLGGRRTRRRETQFIEALTQSAFESHDG